MQERKFEQIDALRFFAVLPVLTSHWKLFNISDSAQFLLASNGVNLFFAISGFLITLGLIRSKEKSKSIQINLVHFYARRFLRIFPIYYLLLALMWFLNNKRVADGIIWYLSYSTNFYCIKINDWGGLPHLWSLAIEEQFYIVWPLFILLAPKRAMPIIIAGAIALSLLFKTYCIYAHESFWVYYMNPISVIDTLGLGALLAYMYYSNQDKLRQLLYSRFVIIFLFFQFVLILCLKENKSSEFIYQIFNRFSFGLLSIWLIGRATIGFNGFIGSMFSFKPITYIGKISYGVYLYHIIVPGMLMGLKYPIDNTLRFLMYFIVTIAISSISWEYFECKILKFKHKFD
jgi:peptidoglycan/LPS O-acetylase OafA/YrhL